jgi:RNA polymerase sigma-70 factor (ECF subfamily)
MLEASMDEREARDAGTAASPTPTSTAHDAAFSRFYRSFIATLVSFLRWQGVPLREAADIAQETMIEAYRSWATIRSPQAWARRVAARMWARRVADVAEDPVADVPEQATSLLAITDVVAWEQRHDVLQVLDALPPRQRQVLAWAVDGYTPAEIADELKMSPDAVRASLRKARRALATHPRVTGGQ